ncbi:hypothetical protein [Geoalkalibacter halelectricus]|uniref:Uncharacterized protein n=1 Tax=Geoalkalibacter halelectricus TaxID=2847045 RepID=A0ABY5ZQE6_9BACT|nr:hypothetical protein [Geoalkalibacter halelectricus]MDO3377412.1 hypothetical protein [Geoalkalibacter halelectricus]UWZ80828.1 hypothetical protein L9S41_05350 [Geoalkalibacter halelectricus]
MSDSQLDLVRRRIAQDQRLAGCSATREGQELHLARGDDLFARLIPAAGEGLWRMEYFHNQERWEIIEFQGPLDACLDFLGEHPHYLFFQ